MEVVRLAGVLLPATDPEALSRWYVDHLGADDPATLRVLPTEQLGPGDRMSIVGEVRDLDAMVAQLRAAGVAVDVDPESHLFERRARLTDPGGNQVELRQQTGVRAVGEPGGHARPAGRWASLIIGALFLVVAASVAVALSGVGQRPDEDTELDQVRAADRDIRRALLAADMDVLRRDLAPDFVLVPPPGERLSRGEFLQAIASGDLDFQRFEPVSEIKGRLDGDLAVLTYAADTDVVADFDVVAGVGTGPTRATSTAWVTHVYERRDGRWQLASGQTTGVGGFPPPTPR